MQSFYTQLFSDTQCRDSQMAALAHITRLNNDKLRSLAALIIWGIWN